MADQKRVPESAICIRESILLVPVFAFPQAQGSLIIYNVTVMVRGNIKSFREEDRYGGVSEFKPFLLGNVMIPWLLFNRMNALDFVALGQGSVR